MEGFDEDSTERVLGGSLSSVRMPRIYDRLDMSGHPVIDRQPLSPAERDQMLTYLDSGTVVLATSGLGLDVFDPDRGRTVPMSFRTDGAWIWSDAVAHYLRTHDIAPDPDLLKRARDREFHVSQVSQKDLDQVLAVLTAGGLDSPHEQRPRWKVDRPDVADSVSMWTSDRSMVLDLDVGGSPDSVMTLALAAANTALALVVTNDEQDGIRARFARRLLDLCGREDVPVVAGRDLGNRDGDLSRYVSDDVPAQSADLVGAVADVLRHTDGHADWINVGASSNLAFLVEEHRQLTENLRVLQTGTQREVSLDLPAARTVLAATGFEYAVLADGAGQWAFEFDSHSAQYGTIADYDLIAGQTHPAFALLTDYLERWFADVGPRSRIGGPVLMTYAHGRRFLTSVASIAISDSGGFQPGEFTVKFIRPLRPKYMTEWIDDRLTQLIAVMEYEAE